jgi:hypothetical protein
VTPHFLNLNNEIIFHKSQDNFIRFIVMPLFKEIQEFNQISLDLKYVKREEENNKKNVFQNDLDESIKEHKKSTNSLDSVNPEIQRKIIHKLSKLNGIIEILESNWNKHQELSKSPPH